MKKQLIGVEVGVTLPITHEEFDQYFVKGIDRSLYDENRITYFIEDLGDAIAFAKDYVKEGVERTYALVYHLGECNLMEEDIEEIKDNNYYECNELDVDCLIESFYKEVE